MPGPHARVVGRYALYDAIASGGMATVHFGQLLGPIGFSRLVAIKQLLPHHAKNPEFVKMFLDEVRVAARIRHPNVVSTLDVVMEEKQLFLVLDYVHGETFARLLRFGPGQRPVDPAVVATIVTDLLHGLHAAHEAKDHQGRPLQIVHRDISPQNVIVGVDGVARVLDFGIAKAKGRLQLSVDGQLKGKLSYMPPEQFSGRFVDRRADIYAAAIVLWEGLTGQRLFDGRTEVEVMDKIASGDVRPARNVIPSLPRALDDIALCGLAMDPSNRFQTAEEMARAIESEVNLASRSEVSQWVASAAAESLAHHAALIDAIERHAIGHDSAPASGLFRPTIRPGGATAAAPQVSEQISSSQSHLSGPTERMAVQPLAPLFVPTTSQPFVTQSLAPMFHDTDPAILEGVPEALPWGQMKRSVKALAVSGAVILTALTLAVALLTSSGLVESDRVLTEAASHRPAPGNPNDLRYDASLSTAGELDELPAVDFLPTPPNSDHTPATTPKGHKVKTTTKGNHINSPTP